MCTSEIPYFEKGSTLHGPYLCSCYSSSNYTNLLDSQHRQWRWLLRDARADRWIVSCARDRLGIADQLGTDATSTGSYTTIYKHTQNHTIIIHNGNTQWAMHGAQSAVHCLPLLQSLTSELHFSILCKVYFDLLSTMPCEDNESKQTTANNSRQ